MSDRFLSGKVALVTGSTSGIGLGIAQALAGAGANIVVNGFGDPGPALTSIQSQGVLARFVGADMRAPQEIEQMFETVGKDWGGVDILVNNAGITTRGAPNVSMSDESFDSIITNNLNGTYATIRTFIPLLKETNDGLIVNISSTAAQKAGPSNVAYGASKAGIDLMTKSLGRGLAEDKIRVVGIVPGFMEKSTSGLVKPPGFNQLAAEACPLGRIGIGDDIACTVEAFATHIRFTTGINIVVDGGRIS